ncbi:MAG: hypothetical protein AMXMBFR83_26510, partial [Phycisphaerae bacterium]
HVHGPGPEPEDHRPLEGRTFSAPQPGGRHRLCPGPQDSGGGLQKENLFARPESLAHLP